MIEREKLTEKDILSFLRMYEPDTYGISLGIDGRELEKMGLVEWLPPTGWSGTVYGITSKGRQYLLDNTAPEASKLTP